ncbi:MAG TPA: Co2+/Mg2+ efflux protein ApaG [Abditibacteriaceae bacterium]|jgi:ApaG protein
MPTSITHGIRISVASDYVPEASKPDEGRFLFAYHITIANESDQAAQLLTRHWIIKDAYNNIEEVRGEGVIGQQPFLAPGESFQYSSGCPLPTEWGTMRGTYSMVRSDGEPFEVEIPVFALLPHYFLN